MYGEVQWAKPAVEYHNHSPARHGVSVSAVSKRGANFAPIFLFLEEKNGVEPPKRETLCGSVQKHCRLAFWVRKRVMHSWIGLAPEFAAAYPALVEIPSTNLPKNFLNKLAEKKP
ncbi:MAG: hypothetical protein II379_05765 [Oscillospiraceae bacterium]|nr:hypothetical protein [Oscillospiraceae bacterium]